MVCDPSTQDRDSSQNRRAPLSRCGGGEIEGEELSISAIIPAYNEADSIAEVIEAVSQRLAEAACKYEIIVVDDGSTDGTFAGASEVAERIGQLKIVRHQRNKGYGASLKTGLRECSYSRILILDADLTYPDKDIPTLVELSREYDMVIGHRSGSVNGIPMVRRPAKAVLRKLAEFLSNEDIPDLNSGLRIFRKEIYERFYTMFPNGFSFTSTLTLISIHRGYTIKYVPIEYFKRQGKSKIRPIRDTLGFFSLVSRIVLYLNPLRFFIPLSLLFLTASLGLYIARVALGGGFLVTIIITFMCGFELLVIGLLADLIDKRIP